MTEISSRQNSNFKLWLNLLEPRGIKKHQRYLLFGGKTVPEQVHLVPNQVDCILWLKGNPLSKTLSKWPVFLLSPDLFSLIDIFGTHTPIAVMTQPEITAMDLTLPPDGLELLVPLGDPGNLGALLRNAWAFNASKVILLEEAASPFHPKSVRAASGALGHLLFYQGPSIQKLSELNAQQSTVALDIEGGNLYQYPWPKNVRILIGEEGLGIPASWLGQRLKIPMNPKCESLNAMAASAIAMSHFYQHQLNTDSGR